jgi:hypothetical protein
MVPVNYLNGVDSASSGLDEAESGQEGSEDRSLSGLAEEAIVVGLLAAQQKALVQQVASANAPGSLEGLFAYHVLHADSDFPLAWHVNPTTSEWLTDNSNRLGNMPIVAALGYGLRHFRGTAPPSIIDSFTDGLAKLRLRPPFPDDRVAFAFNPVAFLGIALGASALGDNQDTSTWLVAVLNDPRCYPTTPFQRLLYDYIRYVLTAEADTVDDIRDYRDVAEFALLEWMSRRSALHVVDPRADLSGLQARVLRAAVADDVSMLGAPRAALVWSAVHATLTRSVGELVLSRSHVGSILRRFEAAIRRWRWDDPASAKQPVRWAIDSEREVQDVLWLILRSVFDDVVDEETLPKIGHSTYRADFGIPSLRLLIEAKFARRASDFKLLEKEIMEDAVAYVLETRDRYDRILVFIYDDSASVQEHSLTISALRKLPNIEDVIIVSRPSQLSKRASDEGSSRAGRGRIRAESQNAP